MWEPETRLPVRLDARPPRRRGRRRLPARRASVPPRERGEPAARPRRRGPARAGGAAARTARRLDANAERRSLAANLRGVLAFEEARQDGAARPRLPPSRADGVPERDPPRSRQRGREVQPRARPALAPADVRRLAGRRRRRAGGYPGEWRRRGVQRHRVLRSDGRHLAARRARRPRRRPRARRAPPGREAHAASRRRARPRSPRPGRGDRGRGGDRPRRRSRRSRGGPASPSSRSGRARRAPTPRCCSSSTSRARCSRGSAVERRRGSSSPSGTRRRSRAAIPDVPVGIASVTDRVLPHLFPSTSENAFTAVLDRAMGVERPPPDWSGRGRVTSLAALSAIATNNFYSAAARKRASPSCSPTARRCRPTSARFARGCSAATSRRSSSATGATTTASTARAARPRPTGPTPAARRRCATSAPRSTAGSSRRTTSPASSSTTRILGSGPNGRRGRELQTVEWAPAALALAFVPLLFLLWRRNLAAD